MGDESIVSQVNIQGWNKFLKDKELIYENFYIDNLCCKIFLDLREEAGYKYECRIIIEHIDEYTTYCYNTCTRFHYIYFNTLKELNKKLREQKICKYHALCVDECRADLYTSTGVVCGICMLKIDKHKLQELICGHEFCLVCLNKYIKSLHKDAFKYNYEESNTEELTIKCPMCRELIGRLG